MRHHKYSSETGSRTQACTLFQKVWDDHVDISDKTDGGALLYIDLHLLHEVTSPQAFEGLRIENRTVRRPDLTIATEDHVIPTQDIHGPIQDPVAKLQLETIRKNAQEFGVRLHSLGDLDNGVIHVTFPELGLIQPGMTVVCGDSHTATHGAFGAIAFGIGTSEVEHVLATQTINQKPPKTMSVEFTGTLPDGVSAKDMIFALIGEIGTGGGQGYAIEYRGEAIKNLSMEGRMTISNMTIEAGARFGIIAPDETTFSYLEGRAHAPTGQDWDAALEYWKTLKTDEGAEFDKYVQIDVSKLSPQVTWGTNPAQVVGVDAHIPTLEEVSALDSEIAATAWKNALKYMDLEPGQKMKSVEIDTVFIGSCTNGRIEDLRAAADVLKKAQELGLDKSVKRVLVVPGTNRIRLAAEKEGLDQIFTAFGAQWRNAGCSMCLAMNPDKLKPGERSASTSNRNFEGRQGAGGRTHLVSPQVAAATAVLGHLGTLDDVLRKGSANA